MRKDDYIPFRILEEEIDKDDKDLIIIEMSQIHPSFKDFTVRKRVRKDFRDYGDNILEYKLYKGKNVFIASLNSLYFPFQCGAQIIAGGNTSWGVDLTTIKEGVIYYFLKIVMSGSGHGDANKNLVVFSTPRAGTEMYPMIEAFNDFAVTHNLHQIEGVDEWYNSNSSNDNTLFTFKKEDDKVKNWVTKDINKALGGGGKTREEYLKERNKKPVIMGGRINFGIEGGPAGALHVYGGN